MTELESLDRKGFRYAKAERILMDIAPSALVQKDLFFETDSERLQLLMERLDGINRRKRKRPVFFAGEGNKRVWLMKRGMTRNADTTRWGELMIVR